MKDEKTLMSNALFNIKNASKLFLELETNFGKTASYMADKLVHYVESYSRNKDPRVVKEIMRMIEVEKKVDLKVVK